MLRPKRRKSLTKSRSQKEHVNKVMAQMWFMQDAHLGRAFLFLDILAEHILLPVTVMVSPCLSYVVGMKLVMSYVKLPQAPLHAPFLANADAGKFLGHFRTLGPHWAYSCLSTALLPGSWQCVNSKKSSLPNFKRNLKIQREAQRRKNAKDLIWWADFRLQDVEKQRDRRKTKAKEGRKKEEEETWRHENPHLFGGVFLGQF